MRSSATKDAQKDISAKRNKEAVERVLRANDSSDDDDKRPSTKSNVPASTPKTSEQTQKATESIMRRRQIMFDSDEDEPKPKSKNDSRSSNKDVPGDESKLAKPSQIRPHATPKKSKLAKLFGDDADEFEQPFNPTASNANKATKPDHNRLEEQVAVQSERKATNAGVADIEFTPKSSNVADRSVQEAKLPKHTTNSPSVAEIVELTVVKHAPSINKSSYDAVETDVVVAAPDDKDSKVDLKKPTTVHDVRDLSAIMQAKDKELNIPKSVHSGPEDLGFVAAAQEIRRNKQHESPDGSELKRGQPDTVRSKPDSHRATKFNDSDSSGSDHGSPLKGRNQRNGRSEGQRSREEVKIDRQRIDERPKQADKFQAKHSDSLKSSLTTTTAENNVTAQKPPLSGKKILEASKNPKSETGNQESIFRNVATPSPITKKESKRSQPSDARTHSQNNQHQVRNVSDSDSDELDEIAGRRARAVILSSSSPTSSKSTPSMKQARAASILASRSAESYTSEEVTILTGQITSLQEEVKNLRRQLSTQSEISERQAQALEKIQAKARDDEKYFRGLIDDMEAQLRSLASKKCSTIAESGGKSIANPAANMVPPAEVILGHGEQINSPNAKVCGDDRKRDEVEAPYRKVDVVYSQGADGLRARAHSSLLPPTILAEPSADKRQAVLKPKTIEPAKSTNRSDDSEPLRVNGDSKNDEAFLSLNKNDSGSVGRGPSTSAEKRPTSISESNQKDATGPFEQKERDFEAAPSGHSAAIPSNISGKGEISSPPSKVQPNSRKSSTADVEISLGPASQVGSPSANPSAANPPVGAQSPDVTPAPDLHSSRSSVSSDPSRSMVSQSATVPNSNASTSRTPNRKAVMKTVAVVRQPLLGSQTHPHDKIGIGISFGVTAKGDVFITGMAAQGPAQLCGQIRRGDQLLAVDGVGIRGWDVNDIVKSIIGPSGSTVTLDLATFPELRSPEASPARLGGTLETSSTLRD